MIEVLFYETSSKRCPVTKFLDSLPLSDQATIVAVLSSIEDDGLQAKGCTFRQLDGKLWEIKIRAPAGGYRILYVMLNANSMLLLHAFKKNTQKTPIHELIIAKKRMAEVK